MSMKHRAQARQRKLSSDAHERQLGDQVASPVATWNDDVVHFDQGH